MAYPKEVKEYYKELFLESGKMGGHAYTRKEAQKKIKEKFPKLKRTPTEAIMSQWENKRPKNKDTGMFEPSWNDMWEEGTYKGVQKAKQEYADEKRKQQKLIEARAKFTDVMTTAMMQLFTKGFEPFKGKQLKIEDRGEGASMMKLALDIRNAIKDEIKMSDRVYEVIIREATPEDVDSTLQEGFGL